MTLGKNWGLLVKYKNKQTKTKVAGKYIRNQVIKT